MFDRLTENKYVDVSYSATTGGFDRNWIRYGDNTWEPVRQNGDTSKKWSNPQVFGQWWLEKKPADWMPQDDGLNFSLNHDYGEEDKPKDPVTIDFLDRSNGEQTKEGRPRPLGTADKEGEGK